MAAKNIINLIELEKSATYLLESLGDILAAGGSAFAPAREDLRRLVSSGKVLEPDSLKRCAFNLANIIGEISRQAGSGSVEVKSEKPSGGVEVRAGRPGSGPEAGDKNTAAKPEMKTGETASEPEPGSQGLSSSLADMLIATINHVISIRPAQYDEAAQSLTKLIKANSPLESIIKNLLDLIIRIREDLWDERSRAYKQIGEILKTLENTEQNFIDSVSASQSHLTDSNQSFTAAMETGLKEIGSLVDDGQVDLEHLCRQISQKVCNLNDCVRRKKEADLARLNTLDAEKKSAEQRLEKSKRDYAEFSRQSHEMLQEIENLRAVSLRDPLTGVYNRRAYDNQIVKTLEAVRAGVLKTCSMAVFDIDHFREFNNAYGHLAGDRVLAYVARLTRETLRSDDLVFRYGGDEFVILMPNVNLRAAANVAEKVRRSISAVEFKLFKNSELTVAVTISVGVAELKPEDDAAGFFARADQAMYQAKEAGRNRVSAAE